jgi:hypothetical protein
MPEGTAARAELANRSRALLNPLRALLALGKVPLPKKASSITLAKPVFVPSSRDCLKDGTISSRLICVAAEPNREDGSLFAPRFAILPL